MYWYIVCWLFVKNINTVCPALKHVIKVHVYCLLAYSNNKSIKLVCSTWLVFMYLTYFLQANNQKLPWLLWLHFLPGFQRKSWLLDWWMAGGSAAGRAGGRILNGVKLGFPLNNFSLLWPIDTKLGACNQCNQNNGIIFSSLPSFISYSCHINTWLNRWNPGFVALRRFLLFVGHIILCTVGREIYD